MNFNEHVMMASNTDELHEVVMAAGAHYGIKVDIDETNYHIIQRRCIYSRGRHKQCEKYEPKRAQIVEMMSLLSLAIQKKLFLMGIRRVG